METDVRAVFGARIMAGYRVPREAARILSRAHVGMNGMAQSYDLHMLDAAKIAKLSWDNVSRMTIARCLVKANCLPTAMNAEFVPHMGECVTVRRTTNCAK